MKLLPKIPLGEETENGFRVIDDPTRDFSFMEERRAKQAARNVLILVSVFWLALIGWLVWQLAK